MSGCLDGLFSCIDSIACFLSFAAQYDKPCHLYGGNIVSDWLYWQCITTAQGVVTFCAMRTYISKIWFWQIFENVKKYIGFYGEFLQYHIFVLYGPPPACEPFLLGSCDLKMYILIFFWIVQQWRCDEQSH